MFPDAGIPGLKADSSVDYVETGIAETAFAFGQAATIGANAGGVKAISSSSDKFRGVILRTHTIETGKGVEIGRPSNILRRGKVWVTVSETVADGDSAFVVVASPTKFGKTSTGNVATNGVFRSAADADGVAILEINLP